MTGRFHEGARVIWRYRPPGRYGQIVKVAAVVAHSDRKTGRVEIVIARLNGGQWTKQLALVSPRHLDHRTQHVVEVDGSADGPVEAFGQMLRA